MATLIAFPLVALGALLVWKRKTDERKRRTQRVARIKVVERRRQLQRRLERKAGDAQAARALAVEEARRLGASPSSVEALEDALRQLADEAHV